MAQTTTRTAPRQQAQAPTSVGQVAVLAPPRLLPPAADVLASYKVDNQGWRTLVETVFPAAKSVNAVVMAMDYCARRKLDIFKHPVHIVPIWNSQANNGEGGYVETIWAGINELRTTAIRTGQFAGMDVPAFGPMIDKTFKGRVRKRGPGGTQWEEIEATVRFPEWCSITVYRTLGGNRVPFPGPRVYWLETYATINNFCDVPNQMWQDRPNGQLEKCGEAAALRRAFPEEIGSDYSIDEIGAFTTHAPTDVTEQGSATTETPAEPRREDYQPKDQPASAPGPDAPAGSEGSQPEEKAKESAPSGQAAAKKKGEVTDVVDQNDAPAEPALVFEDYKRPGDWFQFADSWLQDSTRTEAELIAFSAFYQEYILKGLAHPKLANDFKETKKFLDDAITAAQKRAASAPKREREPGEEG